MRPIAKFTGYFVDRAGYAYSMKHGKLKKLHPWKDGHGYYCITVRLDKKSYSRLIGKLVLETFVGSCPKGMETCHGSNGITDDSLKNLSWGTHSKNMGEDKLRDGTLIRGEKQWYSKLTKKQVLEIRLLADDLTYREIAKIFGVSIANVGYIVCGKSWAWA